MEAGWISGRWFSGVKIGPPVFLGLTRTVLLILRPYSQLNWSWPSIRSLTDSGLPMSSDVFRPCLNPLNKAWLMGKPWAVQRWTSRRNWGNWGPLMFTSQLRTYHLDHVDLEPDLKVSMSTRKQLAWPGGPWQACGHGFVFCVQFLMGRSMDWQWEMDLGWICSIVTKFWRLSAPVQWASVPDLNCKLLIAVVPSGPRIRVSRAGPQPQRISEDIPDRMPERMSEDMPDTYARKNVTRYRICKVALPMSEGL